MDPTPLAAALSAVEKIKRTKPRRHRLEEDPPPPMRLFTVEGIESENPGVKGRVRQWIKKADAGDPSFTWLSFCVVRVAGSVFIDDIKWRDALHQRTCMAPGPARNAKAVAGGPAT